MAPPLKISDEWPIMVEIESTVPFDTGDEDPKYAVMVAWLEEMDFTFAYNDLLEHGVDNYLFINHFFFFKDHGQAMAFKLAFWEPSLFP